MSVIPAKLNLKYVPYPPLGRGSVAKVPRGDDSNPPPKTDDFVPSLYSLDPEEQAERMIRAQSASIADVWGALAASLKRPVEFVGGRNPDATVLVIDNFGASDESQSHGETVVEVMRRAGLQERDIQRVAHPKLPSEAVELLGRGFESPADRIDAHIEILAIDMLVATQSTISKALSAPDNKIKTISHSIGTQAFDVGTVLSKAAFRFDETTGEPRLSVHGRHICEALGVAPDPTPENLRKLTERAMARAHKIISTSPRVKEQRQSFDNQLKELKARGISYYRSAGNSQDDLEMFQELFPVESSSTHSLLSVPHANLVGALDTKGTPDPSDDEIAHFSTRDPNVRYLANGVNIPSGDEFVDGTSFAAPYVAAKSELARRDGLTLHELPEAHNKWSGPLAIL